MPSQVKRLGARTSGAAEVVVRSPEGELSKKQNEVYRAIRTQRTNDNPFPTARRYQRDLCDGLFSDVRAQPEFGRAGNLVVQPNPVLRDVQVQANAGINVPSVLPERVVDEIFREQYGSILNLRRFQASNA